MIQMEKKCMRSLSALRPAAGLCPVKFDGLELVELDLSYLFSISPFPGFEKKCSAILKKNHGLNLPKVCRATGNSGVRAIWFGSFTLLVGEKPDLALTDLAAVIDQSDAWCTLRLRGKCVEEVLQRLCPIDVRLSKFKTGYVARTMLGLLHVTIHRSGKEQIDIYSYRSMSQTLVNEITYSMKKTVNIVKQNF